jgi:fatty-acyl-CoA synthase
VAAAVIVKPGSNPAEAELIAYCRERLAGFKTPKYIFFRETMPVSAANKLLKRELKAEYGKKMAS